MVDLLEAGEWLRWYLPYLALNMRILPPFPRMELGLIILVQLHPILQNELECHGDLIWCDLSPPFSYASLETPCGMLGRDSNPFYPGSRHTAH